MLNFPSLFLLCDPIAKVAQTPGRARVNLKGMLRSELPICFPMRAIHQVHRRVPALMPYLLFFAKFRFPRVK